MVNGGEYAVTATATSISTALGITDSGKKHYKQVILRIDPGAANQAYWGRSNLTASTNRCGTLKASDTAPSVLGGGDGESLNIDDIYLIGTAAGANVIFISLVN